MLTSGSQKAMRWAGVAGGRRVIRWVALAWREVGVCRRMAVEWICSFAFVFRVVNCGV